MILEPMSNMSEVVAESVKKPENARFITGGVTAGEWYARRTKNQRINNRKVSAKSLKHDGVGYPHLKMIRGLRRGRKVEERSIRYRLTEGWDRDVPYGFNFT